MSDTDIGSQLLVANNELNARIALLEKTLLEKERTLEALQDSEKRYRRLFGSAKDGILILDADTGKVVDVNPFLTQLLGYSHDELYGRYIWELGVFKGIAASKDAFKVLQDNHYVRYKNLPLEARDGHLISVEFVSSVYTVDQGKVIQCNVRDITERKRAEEALTYERTLLKALMDNMPDHIYFKDKESHFLRISKSQANAFGLDDPAQAVGKTDFDFFAEGHALPAFEDEQKIVESGIAIVGLEEKELWPDGQETWVSTTKVPLRDAQGEITGIFGISRDITERKQTEEALQKNEKKFRRVVETALEGVWFLDSEFKTTEVNDAVVRMLGYTPEELIGRPFIDLVLDEDRSMQVEEFQRRKRGISGQYERRVRCKDGGEKWLFLSAKATMNTEGVCVGSFAMITDITERKRAEEAVRESEERFRLVFENVFDGISIYSEDPDPSKRKLVECNEKYAAMAGRSREELLQLGSTLGLQITLEDTANINRLKSLTQGTTYHGSFSWIRPDGKDNIVEYVGVPVIWRGKPHSIGIDRDVTERKRVEETLRENEEKLRVLFEQLPLGVSLLDKNRKVVYVNPALEKILDISKEDLLQGKHQTRQYIRTDGTTMPPEEFASERAFKEQKLVRDIETGVMTESGETIWTNVSAAPFSMIDKGLLIVTADISERKRAEEALTYERNLLKALIDNMPDHIYFKDKESRFLRISKSQANAFGLDDPAQAVGKTDFDFFAVDHARPAFEDEQKIMESGIAIVGLEEKELWPDGQETWVSTTKVPLHDAHGKITGTFGISRDITDRKRAEEALQENEHRLSSIYDTVGDVIFHLAVEAEEKYRFVSVNQAFLHVTGLSQDQVVGKMVNEVIPEPSLTMVLGKYKQAIDENRIIRWEETSDYPTGRLIGDVSVAPVVDDKGCCTHLVGSVHDITERKRAEEVLHERERLFQGLFNVSPDAIVLIDPYESWPIVDCNKAACQMNGYTREELIGQSIDVLNTTKGTPEERIAYLKNLRQEDTVHLEALHRHKDGHVFPVEVSTSIVNLEGHEMVFGIDRDITERKKAEENALKQLEELRSWHEVTLGREDRIQQLKSEVNQLLIRLGEMIRYPSQGNDAVKDPANEIS